MEPKTERRSLVMVRPAWWPGMALAGGGRGAVAAMAAQRRVAMALAQSPHTERPSWHGASLVAAADTRSWSGAARELEERERRPPWWDASTSAEGVERRAGLGADGRWAAWRSTGELWPIQARDDDAAPTRESGRPLQPLLCGTSALRPPPHLGGGAAPGAVALSRGRLLRRMPQHDEPGAGCGHWPDKATRRIPSARQRR